ncbi:hypothetical protein [Paenibacillus thalictri]|uniref:Uncharacterized protein n=1 Tax=Paenibacillus thalictri TaxID=2527873 RepID=A0A4V2J4Z4_9BACL|nr:hypothetical protein [Paenibacillus thalictri]TBL81682.1 hypothetical protein EYB31_01405 [Paenibacillus thalictri]
MGETQNDKIILFPKTIEYYQVEITRLLEAEKYREAMRVLRFLLQCQSGSSETSQEWLALLNWLEMVHPEGAYDQEEQDEPELSESDLLHLSVQQKTETDGLYAEKLLLSLERSDSPDKQVMALEQLVYLNHPRIDDVIIRWLTTEEMHPAIQFKGLQVLKRRGVSGPIELEKWNETVVLEIAETPANIDEFPSQTLEIVQRIQKISEVTQPTLVYFAEETWHEFLAFAYGTSIYRQLLKHEPEMADIWAAALHLTLQEAMTASGSKEEILELYGITSDMAFYWEQTYRVMKQYMRLIGPAGM